jgi:uncharacterized protein (DUF1778 family)
VSEHQEIRRRLAAIGKNRKWLAAQLRMSEHTIRQYLQPKGKRTKEFLDEIERVITLETARQRETQPEAPPWNVLFRTAEEFDLVDRASRLEKAESITEFCRGVLIKRAAEILEEKERSRYPAGTVRALKVADKPKKDGE